MNFLETSIKDLIILNPNVFNDDRGSFIKIFSANFFKENSIDFDIKESYYTFSNKDVIRGMHFQIPPFDHDKIVYVSQGRILDVVLDIRKESLTYGKYYSIELSSENKKILIIPKGLAHGFKSLEDNTCVNYLQTTCYSPSADKGIRYDSFGFDWNCTNSILSERDLSFEIFDDFSSPFKDKEI